MKTDTEIVQTVVSSPELLNRVIDTQEARSIIYRQAEMSFHQGPLPSPKDVERYSAHIPDFGERIMSYAEKEQAARHNFTNKTLGLNRLGLYFGILSVLLVTAFCGFLAFQGDTKAAAGVMVATLVAIAGLFVIGKKNEDKTQE